LVATKTETKKPMNFGRRDLEPSLPGLGIRIIDPKLAAYKGIDFSLQPNHFVLLQQ